MGFHNRIAIETEDGERVVIDLRKMNKKELALSLEYFLFGLNSVPKYTAKIFIDNAKLIEENDFLRIINRTIDSEIAKSDTKNLLSFLRKIFVIKFDSLHFESKMAFVKLHFELLKQSDLQEIIKEEFENWPETLKNFCKFYVSQEMTSEELESIKALLKK